MEKTLEANEQQTEQSPIIKEILELIRNEDYGAASRIAANNEIEISRFKNIMTESTTTVPIDQVKSDCACGVVH